MRASAPRGTVRSTAGRRGRRAGRGRLDLIFAGRGLAPSRHQAEAAIRAGEVFVNGERVDKPGALIAEDAAIERRPRAPAFGSRAGMKLAAAPTACGWA